MKPSQLLVVVLAVVAATAAGIYAGMRWHAPRAGSTVASGVVLPAARPIADFALTDQNGQPFSNAQLQGRWSLLFAGFTHCPDVCPTTLAVMQQLADRLQGAAPAMIFLSVDPQRDTPKVLGGYVRHFGTAITAITGPVAQLEPLCASLGIAYLKVPGASDADYTVDHSAALVLIDPDGRVAGYFPPPHKVDTLAADLRGIVGAPA